MTDEANGAATKIEDRASLVVQFPEDGDQEFSLSAGLNVVASHVADILWQGYLLRHHVFEPTSFGGSHALADWYEMTDLDGTAISAKATMRELGLKGGESKRVRLNRTPAKQYNVYALDDTSGDGTGAGR